jgi:hypothetical protein
MIQAVSVLAACNDSNAPMLQALRHNELVRLPLALGLLLLLLLLPLLVELLLLLPLGLELLRSIGTGLAALVGVPVVLLLLQAV